MFTLDNTEGYTQEQLDKMNEELTEKLRGIEPGTDEYWEAEKYFSHKILERD